MREKPVTIDVRKAGQHWSVFAEDTLVAQTVYEKGAQMLEATLRGLLRYTSRKLFRKAVSDAQKGPKQTEPAKGQKPTKPAKEPNAAKAKSATAKSKAKKASADSPPVKKERAADAAPGNAAPPTEAPTSEPPTVPAAPAN